MVITAFAFLTVCISSIAVSLMGTGGTAVINVSDFGSSGVLNPRGVGI